MTSESKRRIGLYGIVISTYRYTDDCMIASNRVNTKLSAGDELDSGIIRRCSKVKYVFSRAKVFTRTVTF